MSQDTERRHITVDTPQHNGMAESLNRRLLELVCTMLHQAGRAAEEEESTGGSTLRFLVENP